VIFLGRRQRVEYPGAMYHVIQRGNNREYFFNEPEDRNYLVEQMRTAVDVDGVEMFAYVVMSNHYHLLLRTGEEPLSKVMHRMNTRFSKYYNLKAERTGHVFEGRYKSIPVQNDNYLLSLVRYIHRNPLRAGLCLNIKDYQWSSDHCYRDIGSGFVNCSLLFDLLANDRLEACREYNLLMNVEDDIDWEKTPSIGDKAFSELVEPRPATSGRKALDEILFATGVDPEGFRGIKNGSRKRVLKPYKIAYAIEASRQGYTMMEIGRNIGVSDSAVEKYLR
jgi:REP element-mobilizing transposase RayT